MKNELIIKEISELKNIEESKAKQIKETFDPMVKMLSEFEDSFNEINSLASKEITIELTADAKRLRINIGRVRIKTEAVRKEQKEQYLRAGKAIDGVSNILKWAILEKENRLKEIENHFIIIEKNRIIKLQAERESELSKYVDEFIDPRLGEMDSDVWGAFIKTKKDSYLQAIENKKEEERKRLELEKQLEEERKRLAEENKKLRQAYTEKERLLKIERDKALAASTKLAEQEKERQRIIAEQEKERQRIITEQETILENEANKEDSEKMKDLIEDLTKLKVKYYFKSTKYITLYANSIGLIDKIIKYIGS